MGVLGPNRCVLAVRKGFGSSQLEPAVPLLFLVLASSCGPAPPSGSSVAADAPVASVAVAPQSAQVDTSSFVQLTATQGGSGSVTWSIDGESPGNQTLGTISTNGLYTAPAVVPYPATVVVRATSVSNSSNSATALIKVISPGEDWPKYRRDLSNSGVSGETGISSQNVSTLQLKWKFNAGYSILSSPVVATVQGLRRLYVGSAVGNFYALNADTGALLWAYAVDPVGPCAVYNLGCQLASSAAVENGKVYFGASNAFVYALDATAGSLVWKTQLGDPNQGYAIYTSPAVYKGVVYVGVASDYDAPCVPGRVVALDAATGAQVWNFDTIDQSSCPTGNCVGAAVWSSPALDLRFGNLYVGTGNPAGTCSPAGLNATRYPDGILALDLNTGEFKSYYRAVTNDTTDADFGAAPILHQTEVVDDCAGTDQISYWVTVAGKNGSVYTAPRGASGLLANPGMVNIGPELIAAPLALPSYQSQSCGQQTLQSTRGSNKLFQLTVDGYFCSLQQASDGAVNLLGTGPMLACPSGDSCLYWSSPAGINDVVFFGGGDNALHAANTSGEMLWQFNTQGNVVSSPAISHGSVYFGAGDGYVYCLSNH